MDERGEAPRGHPHWVPYESWNTTVMKEVVTYTGRPSWQPERPAVMVAPTDTGNEWMGTAFTAVLVVEHYLVLAVVLRTAVPYTR